MIMGTWTVLACATVIFMSLYSSQDFATRLNFKIAPHIEFQIIAVIGIIVNFIFCYVWEVCHLNAFQRFLMEKNILFRFISLTTFCSKKCFQFTRKRFGDQIWSLSDWRRNYPTALCGLLWARIMTSK